jgi:hypothetical protein
MAVEPKTPIKAYFETTDKPTQGQFVNLIDTIYEQNKNDYQIATVSASNAYNISAATVGSAADLTGRTFSFIVPSSNSGASTLFVSTATSAHNIVKQDAQALVSGDIVKNDILTVQYDASAANFRVTSPLRSSSLAAASVTTSALASGAVTSAKIASAAVTLGKIQNGTTGEVITWDTAGKTTTVAVGNSGQVLTSNGSGAVPTFQAGAAVGAGTVDGYVNGFAITKDADADHDLSIATGVARNSTGSASISLTGPFVKQIDAAWATGSSAGGMASSITVSASTQYNIFAISKSDGTSDAGFDTDASATNLLADASGYTNIRRIGKLITDGASNVDYFSQVKSFGETVETSQQTLTDASNLTRPHLLSSTPDGVSMTMVCVSAEHGYVAGDKLSYPGTFFIDTASNDIGWLSEITSTDIVVRTAQDAFSVLEQTGYNLAIATNSKWKMVIKANVLA